MTGTSVHAEPVTDWRQSAACTSVDPELFFPVTVQTLEGQLQAAQALAVCRWCTVQPECLTAAMTVDRHDRGRQVIGGRWFDDRGRPHDRPRAGDPDG